MTTSTVPSTMTPDLADDLADDLRYDYDIDAEIHPSYSGRGMFGDTCVGWVTDEPAVLAAALAMALRDRFPDASPVDLMRLIPRRRDSMGLSTILY